MNMIKTSVEHIQETQPQAGSKMRTACGADWVIKRGLQGISGNLYISTSKLILLEKTETMIPQSTTSAHCQVNKEIYKIANWH